MPENVQAVFTVIMIVLVVAMIASFIAKLAKLALVMAILTLVTPVLITVTWGDGSAYVARFASQFDEETEAAINDGYQYYLEENTKNPGITDEQLLDMAHAASTYVKEQAEDAAQSLDEYMGDNTDEPSLNDAMQEPTT